MKYTAKNYFIDLFIFGLSVWLPSIIYLVLYEQFKKVEVTVNTI